MPLQQRTVEIGSYAFLARALPDSINVEQRTVDLTWTTGAAVLRTDFWTGERWYEELSVKPEHVRLERLNNGAPLLDSHSGWSISNQLGVVKKGSAKLTRGVGTATVRFSKREEVRPFFEDVVDGILQNNSVGYRVYRYIEKPEKRDGLPVRVAVDWEPHEISLVPIGADPGAGQMRAGKPTKDDRHPCVIDVEDAPEPEPEQERIMPDPNTPQPESIVTRDPHDPGAPIPAQPALRIVPEEPNDHDRGAEAERKRVRGIIDGGRAARMSQEFIDGLIDGNVPLVDAQSRILDELKRRGYDQAGPTNVSVRERSLDGDPNIHQTEGIKDALLHRLAPNQFELTDKGRNYRGMSIMDTAKIYLQARGYRVTDMTPNQIAGVALGITGRGVGMHSTSDFPLVLADVATKILRNAYTEAPQTFTTFATRKTLTNYRTVSMVQIGDAPELLEVVEHGEYKSGTMGEAREEVRLKKYGRKFAITREAMINDDLDAFSRVPANFGRKARALESDLVWEQITSNPTMGDGNPLFSIAHANIAATDGPIGVDTLGEARALLRQQTSVDGEYLNLSARYLIVPPGLETLADQYVTVVTPQIASSVNPFQGKLMVISDPRLTNADEWYVATGSDFEWFNYFYLEGEEGPQVETRNGFDIDGLEIKCRLDFAAKVIDWRGIVRNEGDT